MNGYEGDITILLTTIEGPYERLTYVPNKLSRWISSTPHSTSI